MFYFFSSIYSNISWDNISNYMPSIYKKKEKEEFLSVCLGPFGRYVFIFIFGKIIPWRVIIVHVDYTFPLYIKFYVYL